MDDFDFLKNIWNYIKYKMYKEVNPARLHSLTENDAISYFPSAEKRINVSILCHIHVVISR